MRLNLIALLAATTLRAAKAQDAGDQTPPFPSSTYPNASSPDPATQDGSQSFQGPGSYYPSPWLQSGSGDWADSVAKARAFVSNLTLLEKVNLTTGVGWELERCVGQTGSIPRVGFRSMCMQDGPLGLRFADYNSAFPAGVNGAATWSRGLNYLRGQAMGAEFGAKGADVQLGPVAGPIGRAPEGGRNWEGFSPDPVLTGNLVAQTVKGIQSSGVIACTKHLIGNEQEHFRQATEVPGYNITDSASSNIDDVTLHELYLWPFADAVRAGTGAVMCSYQQVNNTYACQNSYMLNHVLKGELGFQGFIMSDWQAQHSGVGSALAGLDMSMAGDVIFDSGTSHWGTNLTIAVLNGSVPQWRVDDAATRIIAAWYYVDRQSHQVPINLDSWTLDTYGYQHAAPQVDLRLVNEHIDVRNAPQHAALIRQIGSSSTVLLKNTNNALPLTGREKFTGVFGEDAGPNLGGPNGCANRDCDNGTLAMAFGSGTANFPYLITPDTAIQNQIQLNNDGIYQSVLDNYDSDNIMALAKQASVAIVFANADAGEGFINIDGNQGDRKNLTLWNDGDTLIRNVSALNNNTIVVLHTVGPVLIDEYASNPNITAILWAGLPGEQSGNSIVDVLYGKVNPGAKLPFTFAKTREDFGTDLLYEPNGPVPQIDFTEGVFIDYRALDRAGIEPTYEFGFGLSYATFSYSNLQVVKHDVGPYIPTTGMTTAAPTYQQQPLNNTLSDYLFPENITRIPLYIYPYLNFTDLKASSGDPFYGLPESEFVPPGAKDGSPQPLPAAGGAPGGNPGLYDVLYTVRATITNTGRVAGDEVPQLYISLGGPYDPKVVLRGFDRLSIQPGGSATFTADVMRRDLSNWSPDAQNWVISNYTKTAYVGSSSRKLLLSTVLS